MRKRTSTLSSNIRITQIKLTNVWQNYKVQLCEMALAMISIIASQVIFSIGLYKYEFTKIVISTVDVSCCSEESCFDPLPSCYKIQHLSISNFKYDNTYLSGTRYSGNLYSNETDIINMKDTIFIYLKNAHESLLYLTMACGVFNVIMVALSIILMFFYKVVNKRRNFLFLLLPSFITAFSLLLVIFFTTATKNYMDKKFHEVNINMYTGFNRIPEIICLDFSLEADKTLIIALPLQIFAFVILVDSSYWIYN